MPDIPDDTDVIRDNAAALEWRLTETTDDEEFWLLLRRILESYVLLRGLLELLSRADTTETGFRTLEDVARLARQYLEMVEESVPSDED